MHKNIYYFQSSKKLKSQKVPLINLVNEAKNAVDSKDALRSKDTTVVTDNASNHTGGKNHNHDYSESNPISVNAGEQISETVKKVVQEKETGENEGDVSINEKLKNYTSPRPDSQSIETIIQSSNTYQLPQVENEESHKAMDHLKEKEDESGGENDFIGAADESESFNEIDDNDYVEFYANRYWIYNIRGYYDTANIVVNLGC